MAKAKDSDKKDFSTEEKIKEAARIVFYRKGFAATRTRDIAEEAEINLALLNYYFRSKQKLFEIIMIETLSGFVRNMITVLNDEKTNLDDKVSEIATRYIDLITKEPDIPTFIVAEIRSNPDLLLNKLPIREVLMNSVFFKQHQQAVAEGKIKEPNPLHFLMNLIGLIVFPFIAKPLLMGASDTNAAAFNEMMEKRKTLIPVWIKAMMQAE
ncbi:TetR/AcrR family transcriptional regulator [Chryseobacterium kwangjuense]|uniref:TetR family transcriptional regulator n=1 Tax=Chryseobacterium kwangjuense TaxID=267125 RepID=A0A135WJ93_9FLAO|nr:TetR family transcriptional regulator [Chryseobacterium kwangjuense]KXH84984.1 TetR family transcriptional regulator [Chryseobacterium kwangjuense]